MRYEDWDVLLFPEGSRSPFKEFKTICHVLQDAEFCHTQGSFGLPTVCCFIPSLDPGTPFQISIHSWSLPTISQMTRAYSKHMEDVNYEARLYIDGRQVASTTFERDGCWPHVITNTFDFSKNGDLEALRFPKFREELLQQSFWSPADDIGRIKIVISEAFLRDSATLPLERVKNIVAFSFQHAPLDVLEDSAIAWPNPSMWKRDLYHSSMPVPAYSSEDRESHAHSPRRHAGLGSGSSFAMPFSQLVMTVDPATEAESQPFQSLDAKAGFPFAGHMRQLTDANSPMDWVNNAGQPGRDLSQSSSQGGRTGQREARMSNTDVSMPDYPGKVEQSLGKPMLPSQPRDNVFDGHSKAHTTTPAAGMDMANPEYDEFSIFHPNMAIPAGLATSLTSSLLNQPVPSQVQHHGSHIPAPEIKSRKETRLQPDARFSPSDDSSTSIPTQEQHRDLRKVSHQMYMAPGASVPTVIAPQQIQNHQHPKSRNVSESVKRTASNGDFGANITNQPLADTALRAVSGNSMEKVSKRSRNFTPASAKVIDKEDEPRRPSPRVRLTPFLEDVIHPID